MRQELLNLMGLCVAFIILAGLSVALAASAITTIRIRSGKRKGVDTDAE